MKLNVVTCDYGEHEVTGLKLTPIWIDNSMIESVTSETVEIFDESNGELRKKETVTCGMIRTKSGDCFKTKETPDSEPLKGWIDAVMN